MKDKITTKQISLRLPEEEYLLLKSYTLAKGRNTTDVIREYIRTLVTK